MPSNADDEIDAAGLLATLLGCPAEILDVTLDQLRTLAVVHVTGTAQRAARVLGREQSSVQKQLDNLNKTATRLVGEALVVKQGRGKEFLFSPSGEEVVELATQTLLSWTESLHRSRRRVGSTVTFGTTEFTVEFLGAIWPALRADFERKGVHLKIEHVRTRDLWRKLDAKQVDMVCGSFAAEHDRPLVLEYDFIEWHRERVALLTNLTARAARYSGHRSQAARSATAGADRRVTLAVPQPLVWTRLPRRSHCHRRDRLPHLRAEPAHRRTAPRMPTHHRTSRRRRHRRTPARQEPSQDRPRGRLPTAPRDRDRHLCPQG